jgi:hypothetical protein
MRRRTMPGYHDGLDYRAIKNDHAGPQKKLPRCFSSGLADMRQNRDSCPHLQLF